MKNNIKFSKTLSRFFLGTAMVAMTALVMVPAFAGADVLYRQLEVGSRGSDVGALQTFLAKDVTLYPQGLVTDYFGFLTKAAVANFQERNGISPVGRVGPITIPVLNAQMAFGINTGTDVASAYISNVVINASGGNATVSWNTNELAKGVVYYSTSPLVTYERANSVDVSGQVASTDASLKYSQNVGISGLQRNTVYYYLIYTTDQAGNVSVTWPAAVSSN